MIGEKGVLSGTPNSSESDEFREVDWRGLGCKTARRVAKAGRVPAGSAAWRLRAPRRSREDWTIEAAHCPYLGLHPYDHGDDAWRISIQKPHWDSETPVEVAHLIATSEAEAFASVAWLDAVAATQSGSTEEASDGR